MVTLRERILLIGLNIAVEVKVKTYFCSLFPVPCSLFYNNYSDTVL
ncbi:MAG: hypothetical protein F6J90_08130 [Moorea sp. SIOASIH]|nr:hypothetical protein [Moorena sp. SIOASIH]NEO36289.1 hypothetical protein [Moorena sp. SIOASIH]NEO90139.1 hypothetical protein [Moorena sp. SIO3G5]